MIKSANLITNTSFVLVRDDNLPPLEWVIAEFQKSTKEHTAKSEH